MLEFAILDKRYSDELFQEFWNTNFQPKIIMCSYIQVSILYKYYRWIKSENFKNFKMYRVIDIEHLEKCYAHYLHYMNHFVVYLLNGNVIHTSILHNILVKANFVV